MNNREHQLQFTRRTINRPDLGDNIGTEVLILQERWWIEGTPNWSDWEDVPTEDE